MSETRMQSVSKLLTGAGSLCVFLGSVACSSVDEPPPGLRGRFVENIARFDDGRSQTTYTLFRGTGRSDRHELVFKKAPDLISNTEIQVWGTEVDGRLQVERYEIVGDGPTKGPLGKSREALIDAAPIAPTNMVMVMVDTGGGLDVTIEQMNAELFSDTDVTSLKHYYI